MRLLARSHLFLILAVLALAVLATGVFWQAPFDIHVQGFARLFGRVWAIVLLPVQFALARLSSAGVEPTRAITVLVLACYLSLLVLLDIIFTSVARRMAG